MIGKKAQAGIMDAMIFLLVASGAATLLIYIAGAYGASANQQVIAIYNYEFAGNALVALHYANDSKGKWFFNELKEKLPSGFTEVVAYLGPGGDAHGVWQKLKDASPSTCPALTFRSVAAPDVVDEYRDPQCGLTSVKDRLAYASSVDIKDADGDTWAVGVKLYY